MTAIVRDGGGANTVRSELARRPALLSNRRLVIWEFAEREIGSSRWQMVALSPPEARAGEDAETRRIRGPSPADFPRNPRR